MAIPSDPDRFYGDPTQDLRAARGRYGLRAQSDPADHPTPPVLAASGLGGFSAPGGLDSKSWLLVHEGIAFEAASRIFSLDLHA